MKTKFFFLLVAIVFLLNSCLIKSLHPFYFEKDVAFNKDLIGDFIDQDSAKWEIRQHQFSKGFLKGDSLDNSYEVSYFGKNTTKNLFNVHMFKLNGSLYLDFFPMKEFDSNEELTAYHIIYSHSLAKVDLINGSDIKISWFNEDWLKSLFKENRIRISHEVVYSSDKKDEDPSYILTASTNELQKFIIKYGNDPRAFKKSWEALDKDKEEEAFTFQLKKLK